MLKQIVTILYKECDFDNVHWLNDKNEKVGGGYRPKKDNTKTCITRCPSCGRENYAMNVTSGYCTWCPFDANDSNMVEK